MDTVTDLLRLGSPDNVWLLQSIMHIPNQRWKDSRMIPFYLAVISTFILLLHLAVQSCGPTPNMKLDNPKILSEDEAEQSKFKRHVTLLGGTTIFCFMIARVIGCFTLFGFSMVSVFTHWKNLEWDSHIMTIVYLYASLLAILSVVTTRWSSVLTRHNILLLLATLVVYGYRDLWQLVTYTEEPIDASEGWILWAEIITLILTSICIPLFIPRKYVPVDVSEPMDRPNLEQTANLFSFFLYIYLDPLIFKANKMPHLPPSELPPLGDYDYAKNMVKAIFPHVDTFSGAKRRHLFFGLMRAFRFEFSMVFFASSFEILTKFAAPIGINRILAFIETKGSGAVVRPWFWILWLFLGPIMTSLSQHMYLYYTSWILVRAEGLITHLLFEHSLRIRLKADAADSSTTDQAAAQIDEKKSSNMTGKINNLVTSDLSNLARGRDFSELVFAIPIQVVLCMVFLYQVLGWSAFAGLATIIILFPIPGVIAKKIEHVQVKAMSMTDARVELVTETINVLRMIKLFGWEPKTNERIDQKRQEELVWIWKRKLLSLSNNVINFVILSVTTLVTYGTFTAIMKRDLSASIVFSSMAVFDILRSQLYSSFYFLTAMIQAKVSLDRVNNFLRDTELLDGYSEKADFQVSNTREQTLEGVIGFKDASFVWSAGNGTATPSQRSFKLSVEGELHFQRNRINLVVGPTGSGKTSILMALLGEMHFVPITPESWFNLPREAGVAYAAQESWVQSDTIRSNIIFGSPYDDDRYKKVLYQCALEQDLLLFEAGDQTEVGERGLTLSGGQKARVTLARAIYSSAEIVLLDDVLAALDVHTSKWIVDKCLRGDLVKGRTIILVTHNVVLAGPIADFVVAVDIDGNASGQESGISAAILHDPLLASEVQQEHEMIEKEAEEIDQPALKPGAGKLVVAEEIAQGRVSKKAMNIFFSALSGDRPVLFLTLWNLGSFWVEAIIGFQTWYLGYWGSQYDTHPSSEISVSYYLTVYSVILGVMIAIFTIKSSYYMYGTIRASRQIHKRLVTSLLGTTFRWLDETPTSRVIARCTQDMQAVDGTIPDAFANLFSLTISLLFRLVAIMIFTPLFIFPGLAVASIGLYIAGIYLKAQLSIKREMSNAKSPVLSHFGAAITGLISIRAFGAQHMFRQESLKRIDHYVHIARTSYNINRWIGVRLDILGAFLTSGLAAFLVYKSTTNPANIGFSLTMAADLCLSVLYWVRIYNDFEVQSNSLERIKGYLEIEQEPKPQEQNKPPAAWPTSGKLIVENLSARYSPTGPEVLHNISFHVNAGERIGIVGRTGSGKSSLTLSLLRSIPTDGTVYYDDLPTQNMNLDALRSNITIIPQLPELLSGTLRRNLDPFEQYEDATLNDALRAAGLTTLQDQAGESRLTLDSNISSAGRNLSVGQRQIIALARAIVRRSKLLILDEATSAIDYKTDSIIQTTLRNELPSDVTVITVAHRLQTIMDADKIMVLDSGRIVEFDGPKNLLNNSDGMLKSLVDSSDDRDILYAMAESNLTPK